MFVRPALAYLAGERTWHRVVENAILDESITSDGRESYLRGVLEDTGQERRVRLTGHQGSGNMFSLVQANAIVIMPAGVKKIPKGSHVKIWSL